jgi:hypothetical protein
MNQNSTQTPIKKNLESILHERDEIINQVLEMEGELNKELESLISLNAQEFETKIDNCYEFFQYLKTEAAEFKERADRLYARSKSIENLKSSLEERLKMIMRVNGSDRFDGAAWSFVLSKTKGTLVTNDDMNFWADSPYLKTETKQSLDKESIRAALDAGNSVVGARIEEGFSLRQYPRTKFKEKKSHEVGTNK